MIGPPNPYLALTYLFARSTPRFWILLQNRLVSGLMFRRWGRVRRAVCRNLAPVVGRSPEDPTVLGLARRTFENYGVYLVDYLQIHRLRSRAPRFLIPEQDGIRHFRDAMAPGRGAILVTPHLGNWELGGVSFALRNHPLYALTLQDRVERLQDYRDWIRGTLNIQTVRIDPDGYDTALKLAGLLRRKQVIAMLGDRWEGGKSVPVPFFGRRVRFPAGGAAVALVTGAPIIPVFTVLQPNGRYRSWMEPPIHVERGRGADAKTLVTRATREIAAVFEKTIAKYPDQWYHFFDYWDRYGA